jgi:hypothetical protein
MKWSEVLDRWENGGVLTYPKLMNNRFLWKTSKIDKTYNSNFVEKFIEVDNLPSKQNYTSFAEYFKGNNVVSFKNISGDTTLIVPIPKKGKNYITLKDFIDNAPISQQKHVWKHVALIAKKMLKNNNQIWISTHGYGVAYLIIHYT